MSFELQFSIWIDPEGLGAPGGFAAGTPAAESYVQSVRKVIANVGRSGVGRVLLRHAAGHGKTIRISPVDDLRNSAAAPDHRDLAFSQHVRPVLNAFSPTAFKPIGTSVKFTPQFCTSGSNCKDSFLASNGFVPTPESVLVHEYLHVNVQLSKNRQGTLPQLGAGWGHGEGEEFVAVIVENIYRSEQKTNLRAHHNGWKDLSEELAASFEFYKVSGKAFEVVDRFCRGEPKLAKALSCVKTKFNPIAAYFKNQGKARAMSDSPDARIHDQGLPGVLAREIWKRLQ